jgi:hypothetical protein
MICFTDWGIKKGCELWVMSCELWVIGCGLLVVGYWLWVIGFNKLKKNIKHTFLITHNLQPTTDN